MNSRPPKPDAADGHTGPNCAHCEAEKANDAKLAAAQKHSQLEDLARLREIGMKFVERLDRRACGLLLRDEEFGFTGHTDITLNFCRVSRAIRQIMAMEQELIGLREPIVRRAPADAPAETAASASPAKADSREAPDRDHERDDLRERGDLDDLDDYDRRPMGEVVARIRKTLKIAPSELPTTYENFPLAQPARPKTDSRVWTPPAAAPERHFPTAAGPP